MTLITYNSRAMGFSAPTFVTNSECLGLGHEMQVQGSVCFETFRFFSR